MYAEQGQRYTDTIKNYMETEGSQWFHQPFVTVNADKTERQSQEEWANATLDTRTIMDQDGNVYNNLRDSDGDVNEDLLVLTKAMKEGKVTYNGTLDPKHIFTEKGGDNMARV